MMSEQVNTGPLADGAVEERDGVLLCRFGGIVFVWAEPGAGQIEMRPASEDLAYGGPVLAYLEPRRIADGLPVAFQTDEFERHCIDFLREAGRAEIIAEPQAPPQKPHVVRTLDCSIDGGTIDIQVEVVQDEHGRFGTIMVSEDLEEAHLKAEDAAALSQLFAQACAGIAYADTEAFREEAAATAARGADPATPVESSGMERPSRCPTCDSPAANRFPATAHEGEALGCPDEWHLTDPVTPPNDVTKELVERGRRNAAAGKPSRYRRKPVVIEAMRFRPYSDPQEAMRMAEFLEGCTDWRISGDEPGVIIPTPEGDHLARPGDWIIKGVRGEFYPCQPDIFEATYELAEEDDEVPF